LIVLVAAGTTAAAGAAEVGMEDNIGGRGSLKGQTFVLEILDGKLLQVQMS